MKITVIRFEKLYPTGSYANEKLIAEVSLNDGDDPLYAFEMARKLVDEDFEKHNPHLVTPDIKVIPRPRIDKDSNEMVKEAQQTLEEQINTCTSPAVLKAVYEKIVKGKPEEKVYNKKLKELSK